VGPGIGFVGEEEIYAAGDASDSHPRMERFRRLTGFLDDAEEAAYERVSAKVYG
jgi:hypothetical protein